MKTKIMLTVFFVVLLFCTQIFSQSQLVSIKKSFAENRMFDQTTQMVSTNNLNGNFERVQKKRIIKDQSSDGVENFPEANFQVILASPVSGEIVKTNSPRLTWVVPASMNDVIFELEYSTNIDFEEAISIKSLTTNEIILDNLEPATKYFWRVRSSDSENNIIYSRIETFETPMSDLDFLNLGLSKTF